MAWMVVISSTRCAPLLVFHSPRQALLCTIAYDQPAPLGYTAVVSAMAAEYQVFLNDTFTHILKDHQEHTQYPLVGVHITAAAALLEPPTFAAGVWIGGYEGRLFNPILVKAALRPLLFLFVSNNIMSPLSTSAILSLHSQIPPPTTFGNDRFLLS